LVQTVNLQGRVSPQQARQSPYLYLPFQVPSGTTRIDVSYGYSDSVTAPFGMGPGNTVDIGIFDSRGHEFIDAPGFRGWSGSAKREFFITPDQATPGYIRGPLFPGRWNVMLGFDRVQPQGARYHVDISLSSSPQNAPDAQYPPAQHSSAASPVSGPQGRSRWVKGDLHCHTIHSDGLNSVPEIVNNAVERGLDFLAVTDHNTSTHHEELERLAHLPITLIPGEEVTTYWGHANMWGLREWVEFRCADEETMASVRRFVLNRGGLISINHPKSVGPPWMFQGLEAYPCMEVWQAPWRFHNWESLERWDGLLLDGRRVVAVGGSDTHSIPPARPMHPHGLGNPTTWVYAEGGPSEQSILDGIRKGHAFLSDDPDGPHVILTADEDGDGKYEKMMGDTVRAPEGNRISFRVSVQGGADRRLWLMCDGAPLDIIPLDQVDSTLDFSLETSGRRYIRAELRGRRGRPERGEVVWAMTNPIWLETQPDTT
jgi:hypothetical protein